MSAHLAVRTSPWLPLCLFDHSPGDELKEQLHVMEIMLQPENFADEVSWAFDQLRLSTQGFFCHLRYQQKGQALKKSAASHITSVPTGALVISKVSLGRTVCHFQFVFDTWSGSCQFGSLDCFGDSNSSSNCRTLLNE